MSSPKRPDSSRRSSAERRQNLACGANALISAAQEAPYGLDVPPDPRLAERGPAVAGYDDQLSGIHEGPGPDGQPQEPDELGDGQVRETGQEAGVVDRDEE